MSASINCPSGHANSAEQKFCGQCGVSLAGVCANGHPNAEDQKYCGQCGVPLGQSQAAPRRPTPGAGDKPPGNADGSVATPTAPPSGRQMGGEQGLPPTPTPPSPAPPPLAAALNGLKSLWAKLTGVGAGGTSASSAAGPGIAAVDGIKSFWAKMPKWGKVVAVVGVLLAVSLTLANIGGRDKASYTFGYQRGNSSFTQEWARGTSVEKTCQDTVDYWVRLMKPKGIDRGDAVEGCIDAVNGRPLGPG